MKNEVKIVDEILEKIVEEAGGDPEKIEELNDMLRELLKDDEYEETPLDKAYELLDKANRAKSKATAKKYAKQAYEISRECFDAIITIAMLEDNSIKRMQILEDGLTYEKERLTKEGFFTKDIIGAFYGNFETRPYIRGLYNKAMFLIESGKMHQAIEVCKEVLKLNNNDNTGIRYLLLAIYAYLEDETSLLKLYNKYKENNLEMLIPLFVLYYKLGDDKKACEYLKAINKANPYFLKFFKGKINVEDEKTTIDGYYQRGKVSEITMYLEDYLFLLESVPNLREYVLQYSKK